MTKLKISKDLSLPLDAVTSTLVVYGGKGMGKTNLASVLVEEFAACGLRFAVIDPMGVWWGLRHSADGKGAGIELVILGGIHGDLPIDPTSGALVADLVVDEDASVIIDISRRPDGSMWSISERIRFVTAFAKRVYQRQGEKRRPLNLVVDEAARFAPQIVRQGESEVAACMGAIAVIVEEGRNVGIGVTLVTQRSARLNKDVAELADCMIAFRIVGPNSMRAVLDWLGEHVDKGRLKEIGQQLRELPRGSALVVSPGWLEFEGIVPMRKRETFDSSATPKPGQQVRASGPGAKPDLAKYRERLAEVVERAKADDPKALRARIAELEKQVAKGTPAVAPAPPKVIEKPILDPALVRTLKGTIDSLERITVSIPDQLNAVTHELAAVKKALHVAEAWTRQPNIRAVSPSPNVRPGSAIARAPAQRPQNIRANIRVAGDDCTLPVGEAATLAALIQYPDGLDRSQLTVLTGYKRSTRDSYIARLRERGFVITSGDRVLATADGCAAMPDAQPLPTGHALQDYWIQRLPSGEGTILAKLLEVMGANLSRDVISESTGFKRSTRDSYLSRLAAKQLVVDVGRGLVKASPTLFEVAS